MTAGKWRNQAGWAGLLVLGLVWPAAAQEQVAPGGAGAPPPAPPEKEKKTLVSVLANMSWNPEESCPTQPLEFHCEASPCSVFLEGDYLYLKPRRDALDFAVLSPSTATVGGSVESLDWRRQSGLRAGGGFRFCEGWEYGTYFTYLHSSADQSLVQPAGGAIFPTLTHPGFIDQVTSAIGTSSLNYHVIDTELARRLDMNESSSVKIYGGGRFAWIDQGLDAYYDGGDARQAHVSSPIRFTGGGFLVGGEGRWNGPWGFSLYARADGSILIGDFKTSLQETNNNGATLDVDVRRGFHKLVPAATLGLGVNWKYRNLQVSGGYELTNWFGLVDSADFVDDVHPAKMSRRAGDLSLEGLVIRVEMGF
jgi:hypothetical protein